MDEQNKNNVNEDIFEEEAGQESEQERHETEEEWTQSHVGRKNWDGQNHDQYNHGDWNQQQWNQGVNGEGYSYGYGQQGQQGQQGQPGYGPQGQPGYGPQGYGYQQPYRQPPKTGNNYFGIASLSLGIISILCFCTFFNVLVAIAAIILGIVQLASERENRKLGIPGKSGKGLAWGGIICGIVSIILLIVTCVILFTSTEFRKTFEEEYQKAYDRQYQQTQEDDNSLEDFLQDQDF